MSESGKQEPTFWVTGWLGNGVKVSFTVPTHYETAYEDALGFTNRLLSLGFRHTELGTEPGETREVVGYVCRRVQVKDDGSETPIIDLYAANDAIKFKVISVYLNTPEDIAAFENASGLKLNKLQVFKSKAAPERGDRLTDENIIKAPRPFAAILRDNPNYVDGGTKPKRKFVRWDTAPAPAALPGEPVRQQNDALKQESAALGATVTDIDDAPKVRREVACTAVTVQNWTPRGSDKAKKRMIYKCADGIYASAFTRDHARQAGYNVDEWTEINKPYDLSPTAIVTVEQDGEYWNVISVRKAISEKAG